MLSNFVHTSYYIFIINYYLLSNSNEKLFLNARYPNVGQHGQGGQSPVGRP